MTKHVKLLKIYLVLVGLAGFLHTINFVTCNKLAARDNELGEYNKISIRICAKLKESWSIFRF